MGKKANTLIDDREAAGEESSSPYMTMQSKPSLSLSANTPSNLGILYDYLSY